MESNCISTTGYHLTVSVADDDGLSDPARIFNGSLQNYSYVIQNLSAYTNYTLAITATNNKDQSVTTEKLLLTRELSK